MSKEIYINDQLVDLLEEDNPIALTYAVNNLAELADRQAYATNNFKLPLTQRNRIACGLPDTTSFIGLQPFRKNTAKIVQNGVEILTNGICIITQTKGEIETQILSGIIGFFDLIEGLSIKDLDLSDFDHLWTDAVIVASQTRTDGYIWPLIDYGELPETGKLWEGLYQRPATFRHTIIERIISEAGYTMTGTILTDDRHLKTMIPFAVDTFEHGPDFVVGSGLSTSAIKNVEQQLSNDFRDFDIMFQDYAITNPDGSFNGLTYTAPEIVRIKVKLTYSIRVRDQFNGGSAPSIAMRVIRNFTTIAENVHVATSEFTNIDYLDQVLEVDVTLGIGEQIKITAHSEPATNRIFGIVFAGAQVEFIKDISEVIYGQEVQLAATLPDISQKDFFKEWLQNFGLIVIPDNYNKTIRLINMQEIYENRYKALDWTSLFIDQEYITDYSFGDYGINNKGKYREDDNVPKGTGDGIMILDNQTLTQNKDLFTSQFAASVQIIKLDGTQVTQIKKIENPTESKDFTIKTQPRILMDQKVNWSVPGLPVVSIPYFQQSGLPGLHYQELLDEYYPEIKRMLNRPIVQQRPALLKESDVANIDWTLPIFDKVTGCYYYRNAINNFVEGEICLVSLVKMA